VRKLLCFAACAALLAAALAPAVARADDAPAIKPVLVVSLAGYDRMIEDFQTMGELTDRPYLAAGVEGIMALATHGRGLAGLDKSRPWGVLVATDGHAIGGCMFMPVTDLDKLMGIAKLAAKDKLAKGDNGIWSLETPDKTLYVQETHKGWAFVVDNKDLFRYMPENPVKMLQGLNHRYDMAVRFHAGNVPEEIRKTMCAEMEKKLAKMAERHQKRHKGCRPMDKEMAEHVRNELRKAGADLDQVTLGMKLDNDLHQGVVEISMVAKEGTKTAAELAKLGQTRTRFGGFELPEQAVTARGTGQCQGPPAKHLDAMVEKMRARANEKIEKKCKDDQQKKVAREIVDLLLDVMKNTAASGRNDGAMALSLDEDAVTLIAGRYVSDGPKLEKAVKLAVGELRKKCPDRVDKIVTLDADQYHRVNLHVATLPVTEKCPKQKQAVAAVGEDLQIVVGFGRNAVYLAAGRDAMVSLKQAIARSWMNQRYTVPPMEVTVDLGDVAEYVEDFGPPKCQAKADKADDILERAYGRDKVRMTVLPIDRGVVFRMELDEGALRLMGEMKPGKWHK